MPLVELFTFHFKFSLTSLHLAAWYGQETIVKLLLEYGANVNATDKVWRHRMFK